MWPVNEIRDLFSIDLPIIQAPMAGASGLDMALAVSEAGGLGSLACAPLDTPGLRFLLTTARTKISKPLNANFFSHAIPDANAKRENAWLSQLSAYYGELGIELPRSLVSDAISAFDSTRCEIIEEFAPLVVSFHFGLPEPKLVSRLRSAGCKIISTATTVNEARWLETRGCDAIIAQGIEAGGHRGTFLNADMCSQMGTLSLVPQIVDVVNVPVIAAGGIADARGIAAAFALGASGVQIGTAFLFTDEAEISPVYRSSLEASSDRETALSNVISGRPARVQVNRIVQELGPMTKHAPAFPTGISAVNALRAASERYGKRDFSAIYCGQSAPLGRRKTAFTLTRDLASDTLRLFAQQSQQR